MQVKLTGRIRDYYEFKDDFLDLEDVHEGDILVQPKQDAVGRLNVQMRSSNLGYSGYFAGLLYADGGARRFLKWVDLWPIAENTYRAQQDKGVAINEMQQTISRLAGSVMVKVKGGWQLERDVNDILGRT